MFVRARKSGEPAGRHLDPPPRLVPVDLHRLVYVDRLDRATPTYDAAVRAVVLDRDGLPGARRAPEPSGPGELVHVRACGLCGSDVEKLGRARAGTVLGHEIEGELADGTRVTVAHRVPCGRCDRCSAGHESTCAEFATLRIEPGRFRRAAPRDPRRPAAGDGRPARRCLGRAARVRASRAADRVPTGRVLVVGCGAVGLLWVQVLRAPRRRGGRRRPARRSGSRAPARSGRRATTTRSRRRCSPRPRASTTPWRGSRPAARCSSSRRRTSPVATSLDAVYRKELTVVGSRSATLDALPARRRAAARRSPCRRWSTLPARAVRRGPRALPRAARR